MSTIEDRLRSTFRAPEPEPPLPADLAGRVRRRRARRRHAVAVSLGGAFAVALSVGVLIATLDRDVDTTETAGPAADPCPPPPTTTVGPTTSLVNDLPDRQAFLRESALAAFGTSYAGDAWNRGNPTVYVKRYEGMPTRCGEAVVVPVERSLAELEAEAERIRSLGASLDTAGLAVIGIQLDLAANLVGVVAVPDHPSNESVARAVLGAGPWHLVPNPDNVDVYPG